LIHNSHAAYSDCFCLQPVALAFLERGSSNPACIAITDAVNLMLFVQEQQQPNVVAPEVPPGPQPHTPTEMLACLAEMHKMFQQQQALQEQSTVLFNTLQELRRDQQSIMSQVGRISPPPTPLHAPQYHPSLPFAAQQPAAPAQQVSALPSAPSAPPLAHDAPGDGHHVSDSVHAGAPATHNANRPASPSRAGLALIHASGLGLAGQLRSSAPALPPSLDLERRDPLTVSCIIIQFISFVPSNALNVPRALDKVYLRFRFFDFPPTQTDTYLLDQSTQPRQLAKSRQVSLSTSSLGHLAIVQRKRLFDRLAKSLHIVSA
jgi:hypothetical protein